MRLLLLCALALASCTPDPAPAPPSPPPASSSVDDSVVGIVGTMSQLSTVRDAIAAADRTALLQDVEAAYTLFAPSDAAFQALPAPDREALLSDPARLGLLLDAHTVSTRMLSLDIIDGMTIETLVGTELTLASDGVTVALSDASGQVATVTAADLDTSNGVVHVIDTVLSL